MSAPPATEARAADSMVAPRINAAEIPAITGVRLSQGDGWQLVNISSSGILVEGNSRLLPGTAATVFFDGTFQPRQVRARVARCQISSIQGGVMRFHIGLAFEDQLDPYTQAIGAPPAAAADEAAEPGSPPAAPVRESRDINRW